jgi:hypothetical protein
MGKILKLSYPKAEEDFFKLAEIFNKLGFISKNLADLSKDLKCNIDAVSLY